MALPFVLLPLATVLGLGTVVLTGSRPSLSRQASAPSDATQASAALSTPIRYAALGAADTVGVGSDSPTSENWTARLRDALPRDTVYERFARSGLTLDEARSSELPRIIDFQPTLVTMWLSVNDALRPVPLPDYQQSLQAVLERLMQETEARIALLNVPDLATLAGFHVTAEMRAKLREQVQAWNTAVDETARAFGPRVLVVDLMGVSRELTEHEEWLCADAFHPSPAGYQKLADVTLEALRRAGWLPQAH